MRIAGKTLPPALLRAGQVAVGLTLLLILWHVADGPEAARILVQADIGWLVAAFSALTLQTVLSALRWQWTAWQLGIVLAPSWAIREYYLAQIVNQSLPGGMVGDAGRAIRSRGQAGLMASGQSVVFERLAGQIGMFCVMAPAFLITLAVPGGIDWPRWLALPVGVALLSAVCLPLVLLLATRLPGRIGQRLTGFWRPLAVALGGDALPRQVLLSIGTTLCNLSAFAFCAVAIGADLSVAAVLALVPLILFTMLIPISVSGWGLREGAAAALFPLAGASLSQGVATSVAFGLIFLLTVMPGVLPILMRRNAQTKKSATLGSGS